MESRGAVAKLVARNIRTLRTEAGLTLEELASALTELGHTASMQSLSKVERGDRRVTVDDLAYLAKVFGVPVAVLMSPDLPPPEAVELAGEWDSAGNEAKLFRERARQLLVLAEQAEKRQQRCKERLDELAQAAGQDPGDYFTWAIEAHLADPARLADSVLEGGLP